MKFLFVLTWAIGLIGCQTNLKNLASARGPQGSLTSLDGTHTKFEKHPDYLTMSLAHDAVNSLIPAIETQENVKLIARNEAHVTVITPPEFQNLKAHMTMREIDEIAERWEIQKSELQPVCIGVGQAEVAGHREKTYFVIVSAENLVSIRRAIRDLFIERGGEGSSFVADHFYPHITIGFTKQDLHEQNGVIKDSKSCRWAL